MKKTERKSLKVSALCVESLDKAAGGIPMRNGTVFMRCRGPLAHGWVGWGVENSYTQCPNHQQLL